MKTRELLNIILKIFGLFFIKDVVYAVFQNLIAGFYSWEDNTYTPLLLIAILMVGIYLYVAYLFIFRTEWIIDKLKLTDGLSEEMMLTIHRSTVLSLAIIILGGYILVISVPDFVQSVYAYYSQLQISGDSIGLDKTHITKSGLQLFVAIVLLIYQRVIVKYIEYKRK